MAEKSSRPIIDFGDAQNMAPTHRRVDLRGWLYGSFVLGAAAAWSVLWLAWRPWPGLLPPPASLGAHVGAIAKLAVHWIFHPAFETSSSAYVGFLRSLPPAETRALIWRACLGAWAFCLPGILLAKWCLTPRDALTVVRGAARHEGAKALALLNASLAASVKARPDHEIAPGVPYPSDMWSRHVLFIAGVGSGKSTALRRLIRKVLRANESILLFDPKGEFTKGFAGPDILAPWDARSLAWDIAKDMRNVGDMRRFAGAMIRESTDPMWANAARQILVGFLIHLKSTRENDWGWRELADLMALPQARILPMMADHHPEAIRAVERASVTTQGILINLAAFSASIFDLASAWGDVTADRRVSFAEWTRQEGPRRQIILQGSGAYPDLTKSCLEGILGTVAAIVASVEMDDDEARKLWIVADEVPQMGKVPIRPLIEVGRSRGVRCVLACQDIAQMEEIHGAQMAKSLASMVGTIIVGQLSQGDSAYQMCKAMGTREVERANVSTSVGAGGHGGSATLSYAREEIALYKPSELASRLGPDAEGKGVRLALVTGGNVYELVWPWFPSAAARLAHIPAKWTKGVAAARWRSDDPEASLPPNAGAANDAADAIKPDWPGGKATIGEPASARLAKGAATLDEDAAPPVEQCASDEDGDGDLSADFGDSPDAPAGPSREEVAESLRASLAWRASGDAAREDRDPEVWRLADGRDSPSRRLPLPDAHSFGEIDAAENGSRQPFQPGAHRQPQPTEVHHGHKT